MSDKTLLQPSGEAVPANNANEPHKCLQCRVIGCTGCWALAGIVLYQRHQVAKSRPLARLSMLLCCSGTYTAFNNRNSTLL